MKYDPFLGVHAIELQHRGEALLGNVFLLAWLTCDLLGCEARTAAGAGEDGIAASPLTAEWAAASHAIVQDSQFFPVSASGENHLGQRAF